MVLNKTMQKINDVITTLEKEVGDEVSLARAESRLVAMEQIRKDVDEKLNSFERIVIYRDLNDVLAHGTVTNEEATASLANNQRACSAIVAALDYAKVHPRASPADIQRLGLPLISTIDPATIVLIARCARIAAKYEAEKVYLTGSIFEMVTGRAQT